MLGCKHFRPQSSFSFGHVVIVTTFKRANSAGDVKSGRVS